MNRVPATIKVSVFTVPTELNDDDLRGCTAVVIDVLRTSSTIIAALASGAREVIPVRTPAEVGEFASKAGRGTALMGGERDGKQIEGFDFGNSPREYETEAVAGKIIFFSSTNGTGAIVRVKSADRVVIAGFNNLHAVLEYLAVQGQDVAIICSGRSGKFAIEDFVCAGAIVLGLSKGAAAALPLNDAASAAMEFYKRSMNLINDVLRRSVHGRHLAEIGFETDLGYCAQIDSHRIVPLYVEGKIRGFKPDGSPLAEAATTAV